MAFPAVTIAITLAFFVVKSRPRVDISKHSLLVNGVERSFRIAASPELTHPAPLIIAFHGLGDTAETMASYSRLDEEAARGQFILVYAEGLKSDWDTHTAETNQDIGFVDSLLKRMTESHDVDRNRVYLIGMSKGASFAQVVAQSRPEDIAAIVAHSGPDPRVEGQGERQVPVLLIAGSDDPVTSTVESDFENYRSAGHEVDLIIVDGLGHDWSARHNSIAWSFLARHRIDTRP